MSKISSSEHAGQTCLQITSDKRDTIPLTFLLSALELAKNVVLEVPQPSLPVLIVDADNDQSVKFQAQSAECQIMWPRYLNTR